MPAATATDCAGTISKCHGSGSCSAWLSSVLQGGFAGFYDLAWSIGVEECMRPAMLTLMSTATQQVVVSMRHHTLALSFPLALPGVGSASMSGCALIANVNGTRDA